MAEEKSTAVSRNGSTKLAVNVNNKTYLAELENSLANYSLKPDQEQINCVVNALTSMQQACKQKNISLNEVDQTNLMSILQNVAMLRLNTSATPRECYIIVRGQKAPYTFDFGVEGDGNDKLVRKYGVGVKKIYPVWLVREKDEFTYASFSGLEMVPPKWVPKDGTAKVVRVVYPIEYEDGTVQYHIAERESVATNLKAHISNNLMWEKDSKKKAAKDRAENMSLDDMFKDKELLEIMSPAWRDPHSRESMIIRKMRNNALKPIPKDFSNAYIAEAYEEAYGGSDRRKERASVDPEQVLEAEVSENMSSGDPISIPEKINEQVEGDKESQNNDRPF